MGECAAPAARFVIRLVRDDASFDVGKTGSEDRDDASVGSIDAAIAKIGTSAVDLLLAQMNDSLAETRYSAILGLRHVADPRIVLPLIGMFNDCDPGVRFCRQSLLRPSRSASCVSVAAYASRRCSVSSARRNTCDR